MPEKFKSLFKVDRHTRLAKYPTNARHVLKLEGVDESTTRDAIAQARKQPLIKRIIDKLKAKQASPQKIYLPLQIFFSASDFGLTKVRKILYCVITVW